VGVKKVLCRYLHLLLVESDRKGVKKGVFHEMTRYHIELCYSLLLPNAYIGRMEKLVRNNQSWRPRVDLELRI